MRIGNLGFGKMDSANWETAKWDSAIWDVTSPLQVKGLQQKLILVSEGSLSCNTCRDIRPRFLRPQPMNRPM